MTSKTCRNVEYCKIEH